MYAQFRSTLYTILPYSTFHDRKLDKFNEFLNWSFCYTVIIKLLPVDVPRAHSKSFYENRLEPSPEIHTIRPLKHWNSIMSSINTSVHKIHPFRCKEEPCAAFVASDVTSFHRTRLTEPESNLPAFVAPHWDWNWERMHSPNRIIYVRASLA